MNLKLDKLLKYHRRNNKLWLLIIPVVLVLSLALLFLGNSLQTLEIKNIHSYPEKGDNWLIFFETNGKADLIITPNDQATINDLDFVSLKCGDEERKPQLSEKGEIFYPGWKCKDTGELIHRVNKKGNHDFQFAFGGKINNAYNVGWYDSSWSYRIKLTVQNGKVDEDLTNFPVYVNLDDLPDATFWAHVKSACADARITKSDGTTELPREIVSCDTSAKIGEMYFKADTLANSTDTIFYIYYGNSSATEPAANSTYGSQNVWDTYYQFVGHMNDGADTSHISDSTSHALNGTKGAAANPAISTSCYIGSCQSFDGGDYITLGTSYSPIDDFTVQAVVKPTSLNADKQIISKGYNGTYTQWELKPVAADGKPRFQCWTGSGHGVTSSVAMSTSAFKIYHAWNSSTTWAIFANGGNKQTSIDSTGPIATSQRLLIGAVDNRGSPIQFFTGLIDEVRISSMVRSDGWISTDYNTQSSTSTFYSLESEQTKPVSNQNHFRWRNDLYGLNTDNGWLASEDTAYTTLVKGDTIRLRVEIANTGGSSADGYQYRLEYAARTGDTCGDETFTAVPATATTEHFEMVDSGQYTDGDAITTGYLTGVGTRVDGKGIEDPSNQTTAFNLTNAYYTEFEYAIKATAGSSAGGNYCFRLTNAGSTTNYTYSLYPQVIIASSGSLSTDIVDASYVSVSSPNVVMSSATFSLTCQTVTGTFGTSSQQIYVNNNDAADNGWSLTLGAEAVTSVWDSTGTDYDFNDPGGSGCTDTVDDDDTDSVGGQMTVDPSVGTLAVGQCAGCGLTGVSKGTAASFDAVAVSPVNSITLLTATSGSDDIGDWRLTGITITQKIPKEQPAANDYDLNMVLTVTAF